LIKEPKKIRNEEVVTEEELWDKYYMYKPHCSFIQAFGDDNKVITQKTQLHAAQYGR